MQHLKGLVLILNWFCYDFWTVHYKNLTPKKSLCVYQFCMNELYIEQILGF